MHCNIRERPISKSAHNTKIIYTLSDYQKEKSVLYTPKTSSSKYSKKNASIFNSKFHIKANDGFFSKTILHIILPVHLESYAE